jgi:hypothetical protein
MELLNFNLRKDKSMFYTRMIALFFFLPMAGFADQPSRTQQQSLTVLESRLDVICDSLTSRCTLTQHLVAKVEDHKVELRRYESKPEALLALGTYAAQKVQGKADSAYRLNDSYVLTYPDGKTEKFDVVGLLQ